MSSTGQLIPRSALRHRPIGSDAPEIPPWIKRASRTLAQPLKPHHPILLPRHLATRAANVISHASWSVVMSASMALMLLLILLSQNILNWSTTLYDNWVYGTPRTYQTDAFVGHEGSSGVKSHFIALNNQGRVEVIEFPGNDAARARMYFGPLLSGPGADLVPVTLRFVPDRTSYGQIDMVVQVQGTSMLFVNHHGSFQPASDNVLVADQHSVAKLSAYIVLGQFDGNDWSELNER